MQILRKDLVRPAALDLSLPRPVLKKPFSEQQRDGRGSPRSVYFMDSDRDQKSGSNASSPLECASPPDNQFDLASYESSRDRKIQR